MMAVGAALSLAATVAVAHNDVSLNDDGCHESERYQNYHCHEGVLKDREFENAEAAAQAKITEAITSDKKSSAGEAEDQTRDPS